MSFISYTDVRIISDFSHFSEGGLAFRFPVRISYIIWQALAKWALPLSTCRMISSAFLAAALPLPDLRADFDNFLVFEADDVRFADILALVDFLELLM